ncbi:UNVERIFIED_CONTAM: hypothetical protein GTU68_055122, partial [Idotea baltica]|nr:hypothetical protein [Idotea baltica]
MQKGTINVQAENIFPIIKQFLYSDQEIFLRELVSNAIDATSKLKTLSSKGDYKGELGDLTIDIILDKENNTLTIKDRGIGMTAAEVEKYLNQVAFSSAHDFIKKYKDDANIIGHFGLGFYSAFMVGETVEVNTKSYKKSKAVKWTCSGEPEYIIDDSDKKERGTEITLFIAEDSKEFLEKERIQGLLDKYGKFLPIPIRFGTKTEYYSEGEGEDKIQKTKEVDNIVNNPNPLWKKKPAGIKDEQYKAFYNELYPMSEEPMFWIHLNIDFPFKLTGVLYFPKLGNNLEIQKNKIQLYSNQVYVTDDVKEIVPEFLLMLHGVIDSPDIPLNVSRSYLQSDSNVRKITSYITKKVADKLKQLYKKDQEGFKEKWNDIGVFVKYGMLSEEKFYDKGKDFALLQNTKGEHYLINEYLDKISIKQTNKHGKRVVIYTHDEKAHHSYIKSAEAKDYDVVVFNHIIDNHFIQHLEQKLENVSFVRVDADTIDKLVETDVEEASSLDEKQTEKVKSIF